MTPVDGPAEFGRYRLLDKLGEGGMGAVYRAMDTELRREVALKIMSFGPAGSPDDSSIFARFRRETQAVARLDHPNIVSILESGEVRGLPYFTMEYVDGETVKQRLRRGPVAPGEAMRILREVALAIEHAHEKGVIHRDVTPGNVLVDRAGRVKVADFGISKIVGPNVTRVTQTGDLLGTPAYMAPEQAREGGAAVDARTDVYGMGATLYAILTGGPPFDDGDPWAVLQRVMAADPPSPRSRRPDVPPAAEAICLRAMEKEPARRYASAREMREEIERFLSGEAVRTRLPGPLDRAYRRMRRHPRTSAALGVAVAAVLAGAAFGVYWLVHSLRVEEAGHARLRAAARLHELEGVLARRLTDERLRGIAAELGAIAADLEARDDAVSWELAGEARLMLHQDDPAIADFTRAIESPVAALRRAVVRIGLLSDMASASTPTQRRRRQGALQRFLPQIDADLDRAGGGDLPEDLRTLSGLWRAFIHDRFEEVRGRADAEISRGGRDEAFYALRGYARSALQDLPGAREDLAASIDRNWNQPRVWLQRGGLAADTGDLDEALADYSEALRLKPDYVAAWTNRGTIHYQRGDYPAAIADAAAALALQPDNADALVNRGLARHDSGDVDGGLADYEEAIRLDPESATAYNNRANVKAERDDPRGALDDYTRAIELDDTLGFAYANRGLIYAGFGRWEEAMADLDRAVERSPQFDQVWASRAEVYSLMGQPDRARPDWDRALSMNPRNPDALHGRGLDRVGQGDLRGALEDFDALIDAVPNMPEAFNNRAIVRHDLGDVTGGIADLERFLELAPDAETAPAVREQIDLWRREAPSAQPEYR